MSGGALLAVAPAPFATVQDRGRPGWQQVGVSRCGAMDQGALAAANALVGNPPDAAALEFAHAGGLWTLQGPPRRIAVTGGRFDVQVGGRPLPPWSTATLHEGESLEIGGSRDAVWGYLAAAGGLDVPCRLGSRSTHLRSGIGGLDGRMIGPHDVIPLGAAPAPDGPERRLADPPVPSAAPLRIVLGPQDDFFAAEALELLRTAPFTVTVRGDRLGCQLAGPALAHARGYNIVSDGVVPGCIQVPGDGQPIVLLRDCQPPGGYPKIATIASADLDRFVQIRPGCEVRFLQVGVAEAQMVRRRHMARMAALAGRITTA